MVTLRDQLIAIYKVNQQYKYYLDKAIYVITQNNRRLKLLMLITSVFILVFITDALFQSNSIASPSESCQTSPKTIITNQYIIISIEQSVVIAHAKFRWSTVKNIEVISRVGQYDGIIVIPRYINSPIFDTEAFCAIQFYCDRYYSDIIAI